MDRLDMGEKVTYSDEAKQRAHEAVDFEGMARELKLTEDKAAQLHSPIVWSHNDLLSGNVLVTRQVDLSACSTYKLCPRLRWSLSSMYIILMT